MRKFAKKKNEILCDYLSVPSTHNKSCLKKNDHLEIHSYIDADWMENSVDRRSIAGYFTFVGG